MQWFSAIWELSNNDWGATNICKLLKINLILIGLGIFEPTEVLVFDPNLT